VPPLEVAAATVEISPDSVELEAGSTQTFTAEVKDRNGNPVTPALTWTSSDSLVAHVDAPGSITVRRVRRAVITATMNGSSDSAVVLVRPGPAAAVEVAAGDQQTGRAATPANDSLAARVVDRYGNGVAGVGIRWRVLGDGVVSPESATTDSAGTARTAWTFGRHAGEDTVEVTTAVGSLDTLRFLGTATPNATIEGSVTLSSDLIAYSRGIRVPTGSRSGGGVRPSRAPALPARLGVGASAPPATKRLLVSYRPAALALGSARPTAATLRANAGRISSGIRSRLNRLAPEPGTSIRGISPALLTARIEVSDEATLAALESTLRDDPAVASVEREVWYHTDGAPLALAAPPRRRLPNDPLYPSQAWNFGMIGLPRSWTGTRGAQSVLVAVVDDGIRFDHPDVAPNLTTDGYDFVSTGLAPVCGTFRDNAGDGDGYDADPTNPLDLDCSTGAGSRIGNHGLHVAGTIGAVGDNGVGVAGINWAVRIRPIRALGLGGGSNYDIAQGVLYAAGLPADNGNGGVVQAPSGARIINLSLGGTVDSAILRAAVTLASDAGALVVASAGNDGTSVPDYPAALPEVISVSAVGAFGTLASYSNFGSTVDISAPGGNFDDGGSTYMIASTTWDYTTGSPTYAYYQGTSMAAPHVSGVAALLLSLEPGLTAKELRSRLTDFAVDYGPPGRDDRFGAGILNARNSLTSSKSIPGTLRARAYDARTGELVREAAGTGSTFRLTELPDAPYLLFAGLDEQSDGLIGAPGGLWGGLTEGSRLSQLTVDGAGSYPANFRIGFPNESEPNDAAATANRLVVGSYLHGQLGSASEVDLFTITLPAGTYTFETSGWNDTACGYAYAADTRIELRGPTGGVLGSNDDIDLTAKNYCSALTRTLPAGSYTIAVTSFDGGYYRIEARGGG
jgi:subtilisin family serine protease